MYLKNIWRRIVGNVLINISPSIIFPTVLSLARLHQNCQAALPAASINGLILCVEKHHDCK